MEYILASLVYLLFPYMLGLSGIDYQSYIGLKTSIQDMNQYQIKLLPISSNQDYIITQQALVNDAGYGLRPDFFAEWDMYFGHFFVAPTVGIEPLQTSINFKIKQINGSEHSGNNEQVSFYKTPYVGAKIGLSIFKSTPESRLHGTFNLIPYIDFSLGAVDYEGISLYRSSIEKKFKLMWGVGAKIDFKTPWSAFIEYKRVSFNTKASSLNHQIDITENQIQFGVAYWFMNTNNKSQTDKIDNYNTIINTINGGKKPSVKKAKNAKAPLVSSTGVNIKEGQEAPTNSNTNQTNAITELNQTLREDNSLIKELQQQSNNNNDQVLDNSEDIGF